jgi:hypothetical protein
MVVVAIAAVVLAIVTWSPGPRPSRVKGTITYIGQPLATGKIVFAPTNPRGQQATGQITGGKYALTTFAANDGAIPGAYAISILSTGIPAKYQSQSTSGLTVQVQQSGNVIDFDLAN